MTVSFFFVGMGGCLGAVLGCVSGSGLVLGLEPGGKVPWETPASPCESGSGFPDSGFGLVLGDFLHSGFVINV